MKGIPRIMPFTVDLRCIPTTQLGKRIFVMCPLCDVRMLYFILAAPQEACDILLPAAWTGTNINLLIRHGVQTNR